MNPSESEQFNPFAPEAFYFHQPLYHEISITNDNRQEFINLIYFSDRINYYNPQINENTTYKIILTVPKSRASYNKNILGVDYDRNEYLHSGGYCKTIAECTRSEEKFVFFLFYDKQNETFQKIGQYPSIADYDISQIKKYNKVLKNGYLKEFTKAIGLAANGVGIGSFVYLRRIFESLIEEAHKKAEKREGWNEETYNNKRMGEKIEILKDYLPGFLVKNKSIYGILSIGIHELKEEDCLKYFDVVKTGIELILEEKLEEYNKKKKIEEAEKAISSINQKVKK